MKCYGPALATRADMSITLVDSVWYAKLAKCQQIWSICVMVKECRLECVQVEHNPEIEEELSPF